MAVQRMLGRLRLIACLILLVLLVPAAQPRQSASTEMMPVAFSHALRTGVASIGTPEEMIIAAIDSVRAGRVADARATIDALLVREPNYRLAHLVSADLYTMQTTRLASIGGAAPVKDDRLDELLREAQVRMARHASPPPSDRMPAQILVMSPNQRHVVVMEAATSRVYLFANDNGRPRYVRDYYVTVGKLGVDKLVEGDQRTPLGVYFVTSHMTRPQLDKVYGSAADLYGVGAWPISYPNELDRAEKRSGYGIWLHGSPADTYARAPQASNGCVVLTNEEMLELARSLDPGATPVLNVTAIEWLKPNDWKDRRAQALATLEQWRTDWIARDLPRYFDHYGTSFSSDRGQPLSQWRQERTRMLSTKSWADVTLDQLSIFGTGNDRASLVMTFDQTFRSNDLSTQSRTRLYWEPENGQWRIRWEGPARAG
ncbi:L,D-transpeptidase family protein [Chitinibacteraceae bacterium HSL-7]